MSFLDKDNRVNAGEAVEGQLTSAIEKQTSQVPSVAFLGLAGAAIAGSLVLKSMNRSHTALFVGQWVAPFLLLGLYNKLVKQHGSDASVTRHATPNRYSEAA